MKKNGSLKSLKIKNYKEEELYKKAGFKNAEGFKQHTMWKMEIQYKKYIVNVFGKTNGRAGQENKYDFPPPIDNILFFGSCVLVCKNENDDVCDLTESIWKAMYEKLFGGFDDIGADDSEDDEEEDEDVPRTKEGYVKDGFIVDDEDDNEYDSDDADDDDDDNDEDDGEDEEEEIQVKSSKRKIKTRSSSKKIPENVFILTQTEEDNFTCTSELSEEAYD